MEGVFDGVGKILAIVAAIVIVISMGIGAALFYLAQKFDILPQ